MKIHSSSVRMQLHLQNLPTLNDETRSLVKKKKKKKEKPRGVIRREVILMDDVTDLRLTLEDH